MNPIDIFPMNFSKSSGSGKASIYVKELSEKDRHRILRHFLALEESDRLLRFGTYLPDAMVEKYVEGIDFSRDKVFGVMSHHFRLVGVGHLAFAPRSEKTKPPIKIPSPNSASPYQKPPVAKVLAQNYLSAALFIAAMPTSIPYTCIVCRRIRP